MVVHACSVDSQPLGVITACVAVIACVAFLYLRLLIQER